MTQDTNTTAQRLVRASARLFQRKGYHGTGVAEILTKAGVPKGSLYHHFPNGKSDLALAAAVWASKGMTEIINASFNPADSFQHGAETLCFKLAKLFDLSGHASGCPVSATLFDGPENSAFRDVAAQLFDSWIHIIQAHALRLGLPQEDADRAAQHVFVVIEGGWTLARAHQSSDVLREISRIFQR